MAPYAPTKKGKAAKARAIKKSQKKFKKSPAVKVKRVNNKKKATRRRRGARKVSEKTGNRMFSAKKAPPSTQKAVNFQLSAGAKKLLQAIDIQGMREFAGIYENQAAGFLKSDFETDDPLFDFCQFMDNRLFCNGRNIQKTNSQIFEFFTPEWVKQAHDVLFAGATPTHEPGALVLGDLKKEIFVHQSSVHVYLKNDTCEPKRVTVWACKPKQSGDGPIIADLEAHIADEIADGKLIAQAGIDSTYYKNKYGFTPNWIKSFLKHWEVAKEEVLMEPGSRYDFSVIGPTNVPYKLYEWQNENDTDETPAFYKYIRGYGAYCFYTVANVEVRGTIPYAGWKKVNDPEGTPQPNGGGTYAPTISSGYNKSWEKVRQTGGIVNQYDVEGLRAGVTCRIKHFYKVSPASIVDDAQKYNGKYARFSTGVQKEGYLPFSVDRIDPRVLGQVDYNPSGRAPAVPGTDGV